MNMDNEKVIKMIVQKFDITMVNLSKVKVATSNKSWNFSLETANGKSLNGKIRTFGGGYSMEVKGRKYPQETYYFTEDLINTTSAHLRFN